MDGSPSVLEELVYSDNQRVEVLLTEPVSSSLVTGHFELVDDGGNPVAGVTLDNAFLINSSRTMVFELTGLSETQDIIIRRTSASDGLIIGSSSSMPMGLVVDVATIPAFDPDVPRIVTASLIDNSRVVMEFSDDVYAVSEDDFILEVLNPDMVTGAEVSTLTHPAVGGAGGAPSSSVVALDLSVTGSMSRGRESLRIRLRRNYALDIAAFYDGSEAPKRAATHQVQTDALDFESADAPRLTTAEMNADNTTLTLTFDRGVDYVGMDAANDFTFAVTPGPSGRPHRIMQTTATVVVAGASSNTVEVGIQTNPAGGMSTAGEDEGRITIMRPAIVNRSSTSIQISGSHRSETFNFQDTEAPEVASIAGVDADGNSATSAELNAVGTTYTARWRVTFTEPVTGVDNTDFTVCRGDDDDGFSTVCDSVVSAGDFGGLTVNRDSAAIYTITASGLAQEVGVNADYLLRLNSIGSGIEDRATPPRSFNVDAEGGVLIADDSIAPQVTEVSINADNTVVTITFSEPISRVNPGSNSYVLGRVTFERSTTPGEFSEWVTGVMSRSNFSSPVATNGDTTFTLDVEWGGAAPLNGQSPDGIEVFSVRVHAGLVEDGVNQRNPERRENITLNETAAPQIRDGATNFGASNVEVVEVGAGSEANITWRVRFTETVRNVTTASFTLLAVTDADAGTSQSYTAGTFSSGDSFDLVDAGKFSVVTASGGVTSGGGQYADTYEVQTNGLRFLDDAGNLLSYALRMTATTPAVEDNDAGGRDLTGLPRTTAVQLASDDTTPPVLSNAELDATNTTLTLTFTDEDSIRYFGSSASEEFTLTQITYPRAPAATQWITTATVVATPVRTTSKTLALRIETQGPPPLNGLSPEGGEEWQVEIAANAVSDRSNNQPAPGSSARFTFNDNANPAIQVITAQRAGAQARWTVVFTEPVENVDSTDFQLYRFSTATPAALGDSVEQTGFALITPAAEDGGRSYTVPTGLMEVMGEDRYYALVTRATNNIQRMGDAGQPLTPSVQTNPDLVAGIYTHQDMTPPTVSTQTVASDNSRITITFSEDIQLTASTSTFVMQVGVATMDAGRSGAFLNGAERTALLNEWITAVAVTNPVVSGNQLTLDLDITGPPPLNGLVPVAGLGYLGITLPPLIADVVGGQARNMWAQTPLTANLNNAARPHVQEVTATTIVPFGQIYTARWRVRFTEPVQNVEAADFYLETADDRDFTANVSTADAVITVDGDSAATVYRNFDVSANVASSTDSSVFYRLRLAADAMVTERVAAPSADRAPVLPPGLVYGVHEARDNVAPQVLTPAASQLLGADNTTAVIVFSEAIAAVTTDSIVVRVATPSDWVTGASLAGVSSNGDTLTLTIALTGPSPLNGASADGGEVIEVEFMPNAVRDFANNGNARFSRRFGVNEEAEPRVRQDGFTSAGSDVAPDGITADVRWDIRFTEAVSGVGTEDFTLLSVPQGQPAASAGTPYMGAEYSEAADMTVTASSVVNGQVEYERYTITVSGVTSTDVNQMDAARYALRLDTGASVMDDDNRTWTVALPQFSQVQVAERDPDPPVFEGVALNAENTRLTLRFNEPVNYTGTSSEFNSDFMITVADGTAGQYASVTGASVTAVTRGANSLVLTIQGQGPAPLDGLSAVGGEVGTIVVNRASVDDNANNTLADGSTNSYTFVFNDNAAPRLESVQQIAFSQVRGTPTAVGWRVVFTEPVSGADSVGDFRIYRLPSGNRPPDFSTEAGSPAIGTLSPGSVSGSEDTYTLTVTIPEPVGEDAHYTVSLADGNNISAAAGPGTLRAVPAAGLRAPAEDTFVATLQDLSPPVLVGAPVLSDDNGEITYTFNEGVQFAGTPGDFAGLVAVARNTQGLTDLNGVNRVRVLQQAINDFSITAASVSGAQVILTVNIDGTVTIPAPDYLQVTLPNDRIVDLPAGGGSDGYDGVAHRFTLMDAAQPTVAEATTTSITLDAADNLYDAEWRVRFSEPVSGVVAGSFSVCMVAAATDACSAGTVLTNAVNSATAEGGSDFRTYTVVARDLAQQVGPTWYRLRVDDTPGIVERLGAGRAPTGLPHTAPAHRAADTVGPLVQAGQSIANPDSTARLMVPFSETLGAVDEGRISAALAAPQSEWITGVSVSGATIDAATLTVTVVTSGPAPLNGLSPDGGEGIRLTLGQGAVSDEHGNANPTRNVDFTLNENAAPQVARVSGQSSDVIVAGASRTATMTWTVVFTETVRGVGTDNFGLLRVTGELPSVTSAAYSLSGRGFTATTAGGSVTTMGGAYAETYTVETNVDAGPSGSPERYILVVMDSANTVQDDDGRSLGGDRFLSPITSVDDRVPPVVRMAQATTTTTAGQISITVEFNEALLPGSVTALQNSLGQYANGVLQNPDADYATVESARLTGVSLSSNRLEFTANLGGTLDGHESAVGVEQFRFTIPAGLVVDNSIRQNPTTMPTPFTITVPETGAPEVTGFSVVYSEETNPGSDDGLFNIRYLAEFTEPVTIATTATAFVLYQVADRAATRIRPAPGGDTSVQSGLSSPVRITAMPVGFETTRTGARYLVTYEGIQRPMMNVRGYVAFLNASEAVDAASRTLEDCSWRDGAASGCLSASADVSDTVPPKFAGDQARYGSGQDRLWVTFNEPISVPGGSDGSSLQGFTVNLRTPQGDEVAVSAALYRRAVQTNESNGSVELQLARAVTMTTVYVTYQPPSSGLVIHDDAPARGLNDVPNRVVATLGPQMLQLDAAHDSDNDGVPDSVEAQIGANPWATADNDPRAQNLPELALTRGAGTAHIAYAGIRADGVLDHLGVSVTTGARTRTLAYYSDNCATEQLLGGACTLVDFGNIPAAADHRIAWVATNENGYPVTVAQTIHRVRELNMANERLFFLASDANASTLAVAAALDAPTADALTLVTSPALTISGLSGVVAKSDISGTSQTYTITGLMSGGGNVLWRVGDGIGALAASSYSLGLSSRTQVVRLGDDFLPPSLGQPTLTDSSGNERLGLTEGSFTVALEARDATAAPTAADETGAPVLTAITPAAFSAGADEVSVSFTVPAGARTATRTSVSLRITVPGAGPSESSLLVTWPLVPPGNVLAGVTSDTDADGIPDNIGADLFVGDGALPVAVAAGGREVAGRASWHHIRTGLPQHRMCVGGLTLRYAATVDNPFDSYDDWAASFSVDELETVGVPRPPQALRSAYNFGVCGVDYDTAPRSATDTTAAITGGRAVVIIPLPQDLHDDTSVGIYKFLSADNAWQAVAARSGDFEWGFMPLQNGVCPVVNEVPATSAKRAGDACLVVRIRDGGEYDNDGSINGVIDDPIGVRAGGVAGGGGGGGGGGAFGPFGLFAILLFVAAALLRTRRRRVNA